MFFFKDFSQNPEDEKHWDVLREHIKDDVEKIVKTEVGRVKKKFSKNSNETFNLFLSGSGCTLFI